MLSRLSVIGGARVAATAAQAATLLLLARALGPGDFGTFAAVFGALTAVGILADGGASTAVGRHHGSVGTVVPVMRAGRILALGTLIVSLPGVGALALVLGSPAVASCVVLCLWVPLERQAEVASALLLARRHGRVVGIGYLLRRVGTLVAVAVAPATAVVPVFAASMVVGAGVSLLILRGHVARELCRDHDEPALAPGAAWSLLRPYWTVVGGSAARQVDVAVLGVFGGPVAAGLFAPASRLVPALLLVPGTYTQLLLARLAATRERLPSAPVVGVAVLCALTFGPIALSAGLWVPVVLGPDYAGSVEVVRIVVGGLTLAALSSVFAAALYAGDRAARVAAAVWAGALTMIGLVASLGAAWGAVGAAWGVVLGYGLQCVLMAVFHCMSLRGPTPVARSAAEAA